MAFGAARAVAFMLAGGHSGCFSCCLPGSSTAYPYSYPYTHAYCYPYTHAYRHTHAYRYPYTFCHTNRHAYSNPHSYADTCSTSDAYARYTCPSDRKG